MRCPRAPSTRFDLSFSKIFGLPAHPLFVHAPIVLIPLTGIGAVAMACSARARSQYGWLVLAVGVVAGLSTQLAVESGQALRHSVPQSVALRHHVHIASSVRPLILVLFLLALSVMVLDRRHRGAWPFAGTPHRQPHRAVRIGLAVLVIGAALAANVRLFQIGHSGAKATWQRVHLRANSPKARSG